MEESLAAQKQILFLKEKILTLEKQLSEAKWYEAFYKIHIAA
jgi:hypothetical protein